MKVEMTVAGVPMPKGSKTAVVRGGRAVLLDGRRGKSREAFEQWRFAVATQARAAIGSDAPLDGALSVTAIFYLSPPKHETRQERAREWHTTRPDADKLLRAVLDPLSGIVIADDARIAHVMLWKMFARDRAPGVDLVVSTLLDGD